MKQLAFAVLCLSFFSCATVKTTDTGFLDRTAAIGATTYPYVVYVPKERPPGEKLPVVLFLHGTGERGSDGLRQTTTGIGTAIRWNRARVKMLVVMPQTPSNARWLGEPLDAALKAVDATIREFDGDPHRVVATGISLGGYGVYAIAYEHPERFAALAPVCGGILDHASAHAAVRLPATAGADDPYAAVAAKIRAIPVWIFHGAKDDVIPPDEARRMSTALRAAGANVKYTEFPDANHNSWDQAYGMEELWEWMAGIGARAQ